MRRSVRQYVVTLGLSLAAAAPCGAQARAAPTLLVNTNPAALSVYGGLHYGGAQWRGMTATLDGAFGGVRTVDRLLDLDRMLTFDALWVDQRWHAAPDDAEVDNILAFAATGRRVVIMGENATWGPWNARLLTALGGAEGALDPTLTYPYRGAGCEYGLTASVGTHPLTDGIGAVGLACAGYAVGGTPLFAYNVATLWGPTQNVLTILDANIVDDLFGTAGDGVAFRGRVAGWLAEDTAPSVAVSAIATPEPSTLGLLAAGVLAVAAAARRRRVAD